MIVLDTNVISELSRADGNRSVFAWAEAQVETEMFLCAPVVAELEFGARLFQLRTGSPKHINILEKLVSKAYAGRILSMTLQSSRVAGHFKAIRERTGKPVSSSDMYIAGITASNYAILATRNIRDFEGLDLKLVNPFEA
ncbi:MAG: PIN domain-containing protein [Rhizobiaceae bacterium]